MVDGLPLVDVFEYERPRLQAIATRIVGSAVDADDVVQEAWLRLTRSENAIIENLAAWLTVVVSHIALDHVRMRTNRREDSLDTHLVFAKQAPDSVESAVVFEETIYEALGHALDRLSPLEATTFVLHDLFQMPFDDLAIIIDRTPVAARKLASRARHKVTTAGDLNLANAESHREIVDAFMGAARTGDLGTLLKVLAPEAVLRADLATRQMGVPAEQHGAANIADWFNGKAQAARITWFDGEPGAAWAPAQRIRVAFIFSIQHGKIDEIVLRSDPEWLANTDIEIEPRPRRKNAGG